MQLREAHTVILIAAMDIAPTQGSSSQTVFKSHRCRLYPLSNSVGRPSTGINQRRSPLSTRPWSGRVRPAAILILVAKRCCPSGAVVVLLPPFLSLNPQPPYGVFHCFPCPLLPAPPRTQSITHDSKAVRRNLENQDNRSQSQKSEAQSVNPRPPGTAPEGDGDARVRAGAATTVGSYLDGRNLLGAKGLATLDLILAFRRRDACSRGWCRLRGGGRGE